MLTQGFMFVALRACWIVPSEAPFPQVGLWMIFHLKSGYIVWSFSVVTHNNHITVQQGHSIMPYIWYKTGVHKTLSYIWNLLKMIS